MIRIWKWGTKLIYRLIEPEKDERMFSDLNLLIFDKLTLKAFCFRGGRQQGEWSLFIRNQVKSKNWIDSQKRYFFWLKMIFFHDFKLQKRADFLTFFWYVWIQSVAWNQLWFLMSNTAARKLPNRFVRSTCSRLRRRSFRWDEKCAGNRTWKESRFRHAR